MAVTEFRSSAPQTSTSGQGGQQLLAPQSIQSAVVQLLEVMIHDEDLIDDGDTLRPAEAKAIAEADEWSKHNDPIPHEQVLAEFGLSVAEWEKMSGEP